MPRSGNGSLINFPHDYIPFPAMLKNNTPVTVKSATTLYALIVMPSGEEVVRLVSQLKR